MATKDDWFYRLFINEAKAALHRCSGSSGDDSVELDAEIQANIDDEHYAIENATINSEVTLPGMYNIAIID